MTRWIRLTEGEATLLLAGLTQQLGITSDPEDRLRMMSLRDRVSESLLPRPADEAAALALARRLLHQDGELEIDSDAIVSFSDDNGAYVQGWAWLSFAGTELDRDAAESTD